MKHGNGQLHIYGWFLQNLHFKGISWQQRLIARESVLISLGFWTVAAAQPAPALFVTSWGMTIRTAKFATWMALSSATLDR